MFTCQRTITQGVCWFEVKTSPSPTFEEGLCLTLPNELVPQGVKSNVPNEEFPFEGKLYNYTINRSLLKKKVDCQTIEATCGDFNFGSRLISSASCIYKHCEEFSSRLLLLKLPFILTMKREPRGFAFVQFVDSYDAAEAQYHMNGQVFAGREISVVVAAETRKRPEEMRRRTGPRGSSSRHGGRRSHYGRSRSRSISRSRSPPYPSGSRGRHHSRSFSPAPRRRADYSISPNGRHADHPRSSREDPKERDSGHIRRSDSYRNNPDQTRNGNRYDEKAAYESDEARPRRRSSPGRASRSPSGSRSRSADLSPGPSR